MQRWYYILVLYVYCLAAAEGKGFTVVFVFETDTNNKKGSRTNTKIRVSESGCVTTSPPQKSYFLLKLLKTKDDQIAQLVCWNILCGFTLPSKTMCVDELVCECGYGTWVKLYNALPVIETTRVKHSYKMHARLVGEDLFVIIGYYYIFWVWSPHSSRKTCV